MSQWIKQWAIAPIHVVIVLIALYFVLYRPSVLSIGLALALLIRLLQQHGIKAFFKMLPIFLLFVSLFGGRYFLFLQEKAALPERISQIDIIPDTIAINGNSLSFRGKSSGQTYQVYYQLKSQAEKTTFQHLTSSIRLDIDGQVSRPQNQRNFNGFDYETYLETQGIYGTVSIETIKGSQKIQSWNPFDWVSSWRRSALVHIKNQFPAPMNHYMAGLLFGELDSDFDEMGNLYSSLGIIHLFALSGMQVGFFIDKIRYFFLRMGFKRETVDKLQYPFSFVYAGLTGFSVSVVRSLIQKLLANAGITKLDNLAVTALICFIIMPQFLLTAGGQLSFAYAFLLTVFDFEKLSHYKRLAMESLVLSLGILPLLISIFFTFQPWSIVLTFAFSFLFDVIFLPLLAILFLLSGVISITQVNLLFIWLEKVIMWVSSWASQPIVFGKPHALVLLSLFILLGLLYDYWRVKRLRYFLMIGIALLFFLTKSPMENEVTVVDVGQGDSIFLRDVEGRTLLIDTGGRVEFAPKEEWQKKTTTSNAERTLIPYLYSRGIDHIDSMVITHTDADHCGDLLVLSKAVRLKTIYVTSGSLTVPEFVEVLKEINVPVQVVTVGQHFPIFDSFLEVLYPRQTGDGGNNDSIVLYGDLLDKKFLFTGDLEDGELELMNRYPNLPVDVLKAGHHGSKGSSYPEFLDYIDAEMALLSVGQNNRYQHPHSETLN